MQWALFKILLWWAVVVWPSRHALLGAALRRVLVRGFILMVITVLVLERLLAHWAAYLPSWVSAALGLLCLYGVGVVAAPLIAGRTARVERGAQVQGGNTPRGFQGSGAAVLQVAGQPMPPGDETKHVKIIGTTGTGKSTAIRGILRAALARGDCAVVADPDGSYMREFFDPKAGDLVLSAFDERSVGWNPFAEIKVDYDVDQLARALIAECGGEENAWRTYARTFVAAVLGQRNDIGKTTPQVASLGELRRVIQTATLEELSELLKDTPAAPYLDASAERMFGSLRAIASTCIAPFKYLESALSSGSGSAASFSVRDWVRGCPEAGGARRRILFLPYSAGQVTAIRSLISAWLRLAMFERMECVPPGDGRLWFVADELDALGPIDGLPDALARMRKYRGCCLLGFQSIGQVSTIYGSGPAQTIVENCGTTLILRCSSGEHGGTAQFASRLIGEREVLREQRTRSLRQGDWRRTVSIGEQPAIEPAVLAAEIEQLADLHGLLKFASQPHWQRVTLRAG